MTLRINRFITESGELVKHRSIAKTQFMDTLKRSFAILAMTVLFASTNGAWSASTPPPNALTLKQIVELAQAYQPDLKNAEERVRESDAHDSQAFATLFPTVSSSVVLSEKQDAVSSAAAFGGDPYNFYQFSLDVSQPLFRAGALSAGRRAVQREREGRVIDALVLKRDFVVKSIETFHNVILAQHRVATMQRIDSIQRDLLKTAEARYRIGNEQALSVLSIKTNLSLLAPKVVQAKNLLSAAAAELASLIGKGNENEIRIQGNLEAPSWQTVTSKMKLGSIERPELARNQKLESQLEETKQATLALNYPQLNAFGTWGRTGTQKVDIFDNNSSSWQAGLRLSIPIFSGLSSLADRRVFASQIAQTHIQGEKLRDGFALEQVHAEQNLENSRAVVDASEKALVQARESVDVASRTYRLGTSTYLQVADAQTKLADAELALEQAKYDAVSQTAHYFVAYGWDLDSLVDLLEQGASGARGEDVHSGTGNTGH